MAEGGNEKREDGANGADEPVETDGMEKPEVMTPLVSSEVEAEEKLLVCMVCGVHKMSNFVLELNIPHLGRCVQSSVSCSACGFKHSDILVLEKREPVRLVFESSCVEDVMTRVVKSSSATIRIAELGILIEPGPASDAFITSIEGLLDKVRDGVNKAAVVSDEENALDVACSISSIIQDAMDGKRILVVELLDPLGNSAIVSDKTRRMPLTGEDLSWLKTGMVIIDATSPEQP